VRGPKINSQIRERKGRKKGKVGEKEDGLGGDDPRWSSREDKERRGERRDGYYHDWGHSVVGAHMWWVGEEDHNGRERGDSSNAAGVGLVNALIGGSCSQTPTDRPTDGPTLD